MLIRSLSTLAIKGTAVLALGGGILWQVVEHCGSARAIAYVHVSTPEVDIVLDNETYHVESLADTPIVCELRPGSHRLEMCQNGDVLFEQEFTVDAGQEVVLTAWNSSASDQVETRGPRAVFNPILGRWQPARRTP